MKSPAMSNPTNASTPKTIPRMATVERWGLDVGTGETAGVAVCDASAFVGERSRLFVAEGGVVSEAEREVVAVMLWVMVIGWVCVISRVDHIVVIR